MLTYTRIRVSASSSSISGTEYVRSPRLQKVDVRADRYPEASLPRHSRSSVELDVQLYRQVRFDFGGEPATEPRCSRYGRLPMYSGHRLSAGDLPHYLERSRVSQHESESAIATLSAKSWTYVVADNAFTAIRIHSLMKSIIEGGACSCRQKRVRILLAS